VEKIELDDMAREFIRKAAKGTVRIITNRIDRGDVQEYEAKEKEKRVDNHIPSGEPILFFEVTPCDASEFSGVLSGARRSIDFRFCELNRRRCRREPGFLPVEVHCFRRRGYCTGDARSFAPGGEGP
jgi:hypothetical protein